MKKSFAAKIVTVVITVVAISGTMFASNFISNQTQSTAQKIVATSKTQTKPKYIFMFIGDGMSHSQTQLTNYYLDSLNQDTNAALKKKDTHLKSEPRLSFLNFEAVGVTTTFDSTSFAPDSASTATSLATGKKTHSSTINMDESYKIKYETIAEKAKKDLGYKVGVVSSVMINHATPAAYYAHNTSRNNYYDIGLELTESDFDYFAGGEIKDHNNKGRSKNLYEIAENKGYKVIFKDQKKAETVTKDDGKVIIIGEDADGALPFDNDRKENMWALSNFVKKGIEVLDNDKGFFMMVESGKIDWACHANDAKSAISDVIEFDNAIKEAYKFYQKHPNETLIVVTGDHETGGLSIGYAGTKYDTFLAQLEKQKCSYDSFTEKVKSYRKYKTNFNDVINDIKSSFGLTTNDHSKLNLTKTEYNRIKQAYDMSVWNKQMDSKEKYLAYGGYEPLTITVMQILNNKSGVNFSSYSHTGTTVGTYAHGVGASMFDGYYDNTNIYNNLASLLNVKD